MHRDHRRNAAAAVAFFLAACGGNQPDLCHRALASAQASSTSCRDGGLDPGPSIDAKAFLAGCQEQLQGCSAQDEDLESRLLSCSTQVALDSRRCQCDDFAALGNMNCLSYIYDAVTCENLFDDAGFSTPCRLYGAIDYYPTWDGTWTQTGAEDLGDGFLDDLNPVSGSETITEDDAGTVTWTNFGSPLFTGCTIIATVSATDTQSASFAGQSCGGWRFVSDDQLFGNFANLQRLIDDGGEHSEVVVSASGTDPDGGYFDLFWGMAQDE